MASNNSEQTFYWYDFETFGLNPRFDRPAQFAGMRTDLNFNPIGDGEVFYNRPSKDYLPSFQSILITGITPQQCDTEGMPEEEFARQIWQRFNTPGTISLGYNTLHFDDEVCRFLFWRNFLDPYTHQWKNDCSRWDIFPLTCAVWSLRGDSIKWPTWQDAASYGIAGAENREGYCFKLECLTRANSMEHMKPHDALSDVVGTMALARLIAQKEPRLWQWALENRHKDKVKEALAKGPVLWIDPRHGQKRGFARLVLMIGMNAQKGNEAFVWDLSHDPEELKGLSPEEWQQRLFPSREAVAGGIRPLPIYRLAINGSPFVCSSLAVLSDERAAKYGIDKAKAVEHAEKLSPMLATLQGPLTYFSEHAVLPSESNIDLALYSIGFPSNADKERIVRVRAGDGDYLARAVEKREIVFENTRYNDLLLRYRARNWPESLSDRDREAWLAHCREQLLNDQGSPRSMTKFQEEIDRVVEASQENEAVIELAEKLYNWGEYLCELTQGAEDNGPEEDIG